MRPTKIIEHGKRIPKGKRYYNSISWCPECRYEQVVDTGKNICVTVHCTQCGCVYESMVEFDNDGEWIV
jgi:transcription elongation factor Elf1